LGSDSFRPRAVCSTGSARGPHLPGTTIVVLTAAAGEEAEREAEDAGGDLFLTKPFSPLGLLRLVPDLGDGGAAG